jgi:hypothetical protein
MISALLLPALLFHKHRTNEANRRARTLEAMANTPACTSCGLGRIPVEPHVYGTWPFTNFPPQVSLNGQTFTRARWASPFYSGVVAQYRQAVPTDSQHLMIYDDGSFLIDHVDEANPDQGLVLQHAALDLGGPLAIGLGMLGFGVGLVGGIYWFEPSGS